MTEKDLIIAVSAALRTFVPVTQTREQGFDKAMEDMGWVQSYPTPCKCRDRNGGRLNHSSNSIWRPVDPVAAPGGEGRWHAPGCGWVRAAREVQS